MFLREEKDKSINMDRKDLKVQALLEKVSSLTTEYTNQIADLRVEVTLVTEERDNLQAQLDELEKASETEEIPVNIEDPD